MVRVEGWAVIKAQGGGGGGRGYGRGLWYEQRAKVEDNGKARGLW